MKTVSEQLAEFAVNVDLDNVPPEVIAHVKACWLDALGIALTASETQFGVGASAAAAKIGGIGPCSVIGTSKRLSPGAAALANGTFIHSLDYDDTHTPSIVHTSAAVVPAVLAISELEKTDGRAALRASLIGQEVSIRIGLGAPQAFLDRGFHATALCGAFGAAVAACCLMGSSREMITNTMGIVGSQSAGLLEFHSDGAPVKRLHGGLAAMAGVTAAMLAREVSAGPRSILEGPRGLYRSHVGEGAYSLAPVLKSLGKSWEVLSISFKPYPACHFNHAFMDCAARIHRDPRFSIEEVDSIEILIDRRQAIVFEPKSLKVMPPTPYAAQFSVQYCVALLLANGTCNIADFSEDRIRDPELLGLARKVRCVKLDETKFPETFPGWVRVHLHGGMVLEQRQESNRGGPRSPLTREEIVKKFLENGKGVLPSRRLNQITNEVLSLEKLPDMRRLGRLLTKV